MNELVMAGAHFHSENFQYSTPLNVPKMHAVLSALVGHENGLTIGAFEGTRVVGFLLGEITEDLWTDGSLASEHAFYVLPEHRSNGVGSTLMTNFIQWADARHASIRLNISGGVDDEKAAHMLEGMGFSRVGYLLGKEAI
jgi:GNAT superfamily N-acetyltransferase